MSAVPRDVLEAAARQVLDALAGVAPPPVRVVLAEGRAACLVLVWDASGPMPTASGERLAKDAGRRVDCKRDILAVVAEENRPLTRKQLLRLLRERRAGHGPGTVAKALADLTGEGQLVNRKDKRGHRLPDWPRPSATPDLF